MPGRNIYYILITVFISVFIAVKTSVRDQIVRNVSRLVQKNALEAPEEKVVYEGALSGILDSIDDKPYTTYMPPSEQPEYMREIQGQYAGIGLSTFIKDKKSGEFYFVPQRNAPAAKAGLKFGDRIVEVDGKKASEMTVFELTDAIRGDENTTVKLKIRPRSSVMEYSSPSDATQDSESDVEFTDVSITRAVIQQDVVLGDRYDEEGRWVFTLKDAPEIGYVQIDQFVDSTGAQTRDALNQLESQGVSKVVLDFRGNPGGFLPDAVAICNELLAYGSPIVETRDRKGSSRQYTASKNAKRRFKVAVLINGDSASASEIVSAALQDAGVAVVVGTRSYGKGTVQSIYELPFNSGVLRMTTASFWRPSGRPIHRSHDASEEDEWGVVPNEGYEVPVSPIQNFYSQWVRRIRVSNKEAEALDARAFSFLTFQTNELERLIYEGPTMKKAEAAAEIGLSVEALYELLGANPAKQENADASTAEESGTASDSRQYEFKPQGRAPYFDPQLDRAIDYLREETETDRS